MNEHKKSSAGALLTGLATGSAALLGVYFLAVRPWHLRWGATDAEVNKPLPGDDLAPSAKLNTTHAITIHAPVADVWPWLVQLGKGRGGFYSYDWLENLFGLDIHSADRILPEHQNLQVGDIIAMAPDEIGPPVVSIEPERSLVLGGSIEPGPPGMAMSWVFWLEAVDEHTTRLVERFRYDHPPGVMQAVFRLVLEWVSFVMTQKMLRGIKQRAEAMQRA